MLSNNSVLSRKAFLQNRAQEVTRRENVSEKAQLISTNEVSNESISVHFLYWKKIILKFPQKKIIFFTSFFLNYVFCQHNCFVSTNKVSNWSLWYVLFISQKKNLKLCLWIWQKKIENASGGGTYVQIFIGFKTYYYSKKPKQQKFLSWGRLCPNF